MSCSESAVALLYEAIAALFGRAAVVLLLIWAKDENETVNRQQRTSAMTLKPHAFMEFISLKYKRADRARTPFLKRFSSTAAKFMLETDNAVLGVAWSKLTTPKGDATLGLPPCPSFGCAFRGRFISPAWKWRYGAAVSPYTDVMRPAFLLNLPGEHKRPISVG